jgi:hypothetical protein
MGRVKTEIIGALSGLSATVAHYFDLSLVVFRLRVAAVGLSFSP